MKVDFHIHSTASDGTFAPAALGEMGRDFAAMALTDHDTDKGFSQLLARPEKDKIKVIITNDQNSVKIPTGVRMLIRRCCNAVLLMEEFNNVCNFR